MTEEKNESRSPEELGARLVAQLKEEAAETISDALAKALWNVGFTEEQKSGLIEFHLNILDFYIWRATTVWEEGKLVCGTTLILDPSDGGLYLADFDWLGGQWIFAGAPEPVAQMLPGNFISMWCNRHNLTICSETWLCDDEQLNAIRGFLNAKTGRSAASTSASDGDAA